MTSHGKAETLKLIENLENQLDRLVQQLEDLDECRDEMDQAEYVETKAETMEQLKEMNSSLERMIRGDLSLVDGVSVIQLALRAAISKAFQNPEVIRLFGKRQPKELRERLEPVEERFKLHKISQDQYNKQKAEILDALRQLGDKLSPDELKFLDEQNTVDLSQMEEVAIED